MKAKTHFFKNLDLSSILVPEDAATFTGTKVVCTVGPSCQDVDIMCDMLNAGVVGCRVDLTWGPLEFHRKSLHNLQLAMRKSRRLCCTMVDTLGRELMIRRQVKIGEDGWPIHEESFAVTAGQQVVITTRTDVDASGSVLPITYNKFTEMAVKGDTVYIGRYLVCGADSASLYLEVVDVQGDDVVCIAKNDAVLDGLLTVFHAERSSEGLSNVQNDLPLLSDYDKECLHILAQDFEIDFLSLSYTRSADDVREARRFLDSIGMSNTKILAKLESRQSLLNFQGILNEADGIIISRGNLGLDCVPEKMALVQKTLVQACNLVGKPVLMTRVVDTMINTPRPTRAEATDVANAVLDGVDGILLGAETLRGRYPCETVTTICSISRAAEKVFDHHYHYEHLMEVGERGEGLESIASSAVRAADRVGASLIVVYTHTGKTAQLVAKYRPPMPILTLVVPHLVSDQLKWKLEGRSSARQCLISRSLLPVLAAPSPSGDQLLQEAVVMASRVGLVKPHDHVVCVQRIHDDFCVKIISVDELGAGGCRIDKPVHVACTV
ncbi:cytosolic pyruvate kinase [Volvox carteri f. nagariensis]|uniref:Pyruvate kinase n=1 Tax=Volvox carteri f. nagariensis TaxID=3068 RepID=D8UIV0_VOLCA|nr:cytosolic pyruvate kinase [Volvox carteri f. nagariensis]EFJ40338.1 cytosolic pyruvate kinase [Volvox carteri f. nagariensis]|eukprot:XP_002958601.1 cytosolic pyruvate kinase [Volvox carteri f. nagariensis]